MAIRNALKGGIDFTTAEVLEDFDLDDTNNAFYRKAYSDNTGGAINASTTETTLATVTITQNDLGSAASALITAGIRCKNSYDTSNITGTFRLKIDGSTVKTIVLTMNSKNESSTFTYLATGLNSTAANVVIIITGQNSAALNRTSTCDGMIVDAINNNS